MDHNLAPQDSLSEDQVAALAALAGRSNVFLTGAAGTGKSYIIKKYLEQSGSDAPVLASTGAAAVIIGGRTFHRFFGLGILEGGINRSVRSALMKDGVEARMISTSEIIIDEISMIHSDVFRAADLIARQSRRVDEPFGGIRIIVSGDFLQLPPVHTQKGPLERLFESELWHALNFNVQELVTAKRSEDSEFVATLNDVRFGVVTGRVHQLLAARTIEVDRDSFDGCVLFGRKADAEIYNDEKLSKIDSEEVLIKTIYTIIPPKTREAKEEARRPGLRTGQKRTKDAASAFMAEPVSRGPEEPGEPGEPTPAESLPVATQAPTPRRDLNPPQPVTIEALQRLSPIPDTLRLKVGALVMLRRNDPAGRYVNGTMGYVLKIGAELLIKTLTDETLSITKTDFSILDGDGEEIAQITNFPVVLSWAMSIHKGQGMSVDRLMVNLRSLWEYGQVYVAISRVRSPAGLFVSSWSKNSVKADPKAVAYYNNQGSKKS